MVQMLTAYFHIRADQEIILSWAMLTSEQQLNVICNELANGVIACYLSNGPNVNTKPQFLPFEKATIVRDGVKLTTDAGVEVQYQLGKEGAERFYTKPCNII